MYDTTMDPRVRMAKVESNPVRLAILDVLRRRVASPSELSRQLEVGLSTISSHVRVLLDFECIELVKTEPRRGALEHFYRARPELAAPEPTVALSARQRQLLAELLDDTLNDPEAPTYSAAERRELAAALAALGGGVGSTLTATAPRAGKPCQGPTINQPPNHPEGRSRCQEEA